MATHDQQLQLDDKICTEQGDSRTLLASFARNAASTDLWFHKVVPDRVAGFYVRHF